MTGMPGRSGKARTPEERQAKRRYAQMGGNAAAGRVPIDPDTPPTEGSVQHSPALLAAFPELAGYPFPVPDSLALKDALEAALKQAKAKQADVELDEARAKRDVSRGKLLPIDAIRAREQARLDLIVSKLSIITDAAVNLHPPERQPTARHAMDQAVADFRRQIAEAIRASNS